MLILKWMYKNKVKINRSKEGLGSPWVCVVYYEYVNVEFTINLHVFTTGSLDRTNRLGSNDPSNIQDGVFSRNYRTSYCFSKQSNQSIILFFSNRF